MKRVESRQFFYGVVLPQLYRISTNQKWAHAPNTGTHPEGGIRPLAGHANADAWRAGLQSIVATDDTTQLFAQEKIFIVFLWVSTHSNSGPRL
jgi:hypothetical protein